MKKKKIFADSWAWLWLAAFFYILVFYTWYMRLCWGAFFNMARFKEPFSLWELTIGTWEFFQFSWWDMLWIIIPSGMGYLIFAWRHTRLTFWLPTGWLILSSYYYFHKAFASQWSILSALRDYPEYWIYLPWWFKTLTHLAI